MVAPFELVARKNILMTGNNDDTKTQATTALNHYAYTILACSVRGLAATFHLVPADVLLPAICRGLGKVVGESYIGERNAVIKMRQACGLAFGEAMSAVEIRGIPKEVVKMPESLEGIGGQKSSNG